MSFFDSIPQPPPPEPVRRPRQAWMQPDEVIPGTVPAEVLLIRAERVAVAIGSVRAYPNGFEFTVHVRVREDETEPVRHDPFDRHGWGLQAPDEVLRLGVLYADGRRGATTSGYWRPDEADPARVIMHQGGSSGNPRRWDGQLWVYPLPPEGTVTFVASWLKYGVAETRAELDGSAIRAAAGRAVILWPEEPDSAPGGGYGWGSQVITAGEPDDPGARAEPDQPGAGGAGTGG
jgi:hypothetical protein